MPTKKILWLSHFLPWPPNSGLKQRSYYLLREVSRQLDIELIAFRQLAHQPDESSASSAIDALSQFARVRHVSDLPENQIWGGRTALALKSLLPGPPYTVRWGISRAYAAAVKSAITKFRPDVVHFDTISLAPYLTETRGTAAVLNHHNIESEMLLRRAEIEAHPIKKAYFWQEGRRLARYEKHVAHEFKCHLVCAELDGERLQANVGPVPTAVIENGVDLDFFQPDRDGNGLNPNTIVFVGGLSWYPNASAMSFFIEKVWPVITATEPSTTLRIIGREPPQNLCRAAEKDRRIILMGFVEDIRPYVHQSMVYACPIFDGGGTKLKMLDAMAMGKAIVAHPIAAEGLALEHGREVLLSRDPIEMAQLILDLFTNEARRRSLGHHARATVEERFGFGAIGRRLVDLYQSF
jgi:polysaccharide biosynthesis protein PslH